MDERLKYEQRLLTAKDNNRLSLSIFLVDVSFFTFRKPVYPLKPSCWEWGIVAFWVFCDVWRVCSKFPWQLDGNIASPSPPPSYFAFLEAALNMYKDWGQVGFTDYDFTGATISALPFALCFAFLFFGPFSPLLLFLSVFYISFICPLICSDNPDSTFFLTFPPVSSCSDFSSVQVQAPQGGNTRDIRLGVSSKLNDWMCVCKIFLHTLSVCLCNAVRNISVLSPLLCESA